MSLEQYAFLRLSLSVVSDQTAISATTSQFCIALNNQKGINGIAINQISPNKWITNNEMQYSYGWLGEKWISGIPFNILEKWNCEEILNLKPLHRFMTEIGRLDAQKYGNHFIIDELQTSFIFDEKNETITTRNCGFIDLHPMKGDIIVDMGNDNNVTKKLRRKPRNQLLMIDRDY
ncbi:unnamed protein product [Dracunculus medinensis]|uniref:IstB_IS21 domain-containing protein n=1 Tax=Dracunculus medinensis TaxID=318479 RepID=A0A0N4U8Y0_DRAME|nr:unnamed protein product [Dracunculus medinensis]